MSFNFMITITLMLEVKTIKTRNSTATKNNTDKRRIHEDAPNKMHVTQFNDARVECSQKHFNKIFIHIHNSRSQTLFIILFS